MKAAAFDVAQALLPGLEADEAVMVFRSESLLTGPTTGVLDAAFGARKAALSANRLAQKLDPANTRGEEGAVETKLYTSLEEVEPSRQIPCDSKENAIAKASRCIQCPDISAKRFNRLGLKNQLLEEIWKEKVDDMDLGFSIAYTPETQTMMDDRMILKTDVLRVLQALEETGQAILDAETGLCVTRARLGNVTFWVKYSKTEDGYLVHSAYSHRMNIVNR